jgi:ribosomal protein S18 acetylase RimI-like enzyme
MEKLAEPSLESATIVRIENKEDLDILKGKNSSFGSLTFGFSETYLQTLKDSMDLKNSIQLMVKEGESFCGYAAGYEHVNWPNYLYLCELFVDPDHQGKGIATALVSEFFEKAKALNLKGLMTQTEFENIPAQKLYEKMGFLKVENADWDKGITYRLSFI